MTERYWETRWRDEKAHNEVLIEALMSARRRIEYLGAVCSDPKHFVANDKAFFPKIDAALEWVPDSNKGAAAHAPNTLPLMDDPADSNGDRA